MENPKGIEYTAIYEPDMSKMVKALRIVKEAPLPRQTEQEQGKRDTA
ncbi:hypothetical protein [Paenibacillus graminis]|nr:hypothetical protein [Paenibacillus graminis]MEC0169862.1 hypothetical protein [Paenibacillus graminis]